MITVRAFDFPIASAIAHVRRLAEGTAPGCVLAVIAATGGPSFRPVGASMIVMADGEFVKTRCSRGVYCC